MPILRNRQLATKGNISDSLLVDSNPWKKRRDLWTTSEGFHGQYGQIFLSH